MMSDGAKRLNKRLSITQRSETRDVDVYGNAEAEYQRWNRERDNMDRERAAPPRAERKDASYADDEEAKWQRERAKLLRASWSADDAKAANGNKPVQIVQSDAPVPRSVLKKVKRNKPPTHIFGKLSNTIDDEGCKCTQKCLAELLESPGVSAVVIILIFVDLTCTLVNDICENTNLINPVYDEQKEFVAKATHNICVSVLCIFVMEQMLHLLAFGSAFFTKCWFVMDLAVVLISLLCETVLEGTADGWVALLVVLRLWKVVAFLFDVCLAENEDSERDEELERKKVKKAAIYHHTGITGKLSASLEMPDGWQKSLGEFMENTWVSAVVIVLIFVDLTGTVINDMCENTDLINPKYDEQKELAAKVTHTVCVTVLCIFLVEQLLHLAAFGAAFFTKFWFVMDLIIVCVSLVCETVLEDAAEDWLALFVVLRLWKVVAFVFDMCLSDTEDSEMDEKTYKPKHTGMTGKLSASPETTKGGWQENLGELMENPRVTGLVIILIFVDLAGTVVNDMCENTDLVNPKYDEQKELAAKVSHTVCVTVLSIFFTEQLLHLAAFGKVFFQNFWFVMDLVIVSISLVCETVLEGTADDWLALLVVLRLWKIVAFIFDAFLARNESGERDEKVYAEELQKKKVKRAAVYGHTGLTGKLSASLEMPEGWQKDLGELMESTRVTGVVIVLILVDLTGTVINDMCENTDLINPKYDEQKELAAKVTHTVCVTVLFIFLVEQILHLVAFGEAFFTKFWFVMDLIIVCVSLLCETVLEDAAENWLALFVVLRLWKVVAFVFDMCLTDDEASEMDEKTYKRTHTGMTGKLSASPETTKGGWQEKLGEMMESPRVSGLVIVLIFVDLAGTFVNDMCENTDLFNPKYDEQKEFAAKLTHTVCVTVLCIFLTEQLLHMAAFGWVFFDNFWFVMDLLIVSISLVCETALEGTEDEWMALFIVLRLWKIVAFIFDTCLARKESSERDKKMYAREVEQDVYTKLPA